MKQLSFMEINLDKKTRRKAERLLSSYRNLDAIIQSQRMELPQQMTVNYEPSETQRGNQFSSETERVAILQMKISEHMRTKSKLDYIYSSLKPLQRKIWDLRYSDGKLDIDVYNDLDITDRTYYRLKREMIAIVAEAFCLWQNNAVK